MTASMTGFRAGDVIWVSFPHVDSERSTVRPALVVSDKMVGPKDGLLWAMMVTNALRPDCPGDLPIEHYASIGLPHPSKIRTAKIATLEASGAEMIGRISEKLLAEVRSVMAANLGNQN
jgi:mRNA interferase MazF